VNSRTSSNAAVMRRAALASVLVALSLIAVKAAAYRLSGSVAVLASLVDSATDLVASLANFIAVRHALTPADRDHRFGHGKAEAISGLVQALFIAASTAFLLVEAVARLRAPLPLVNESIALGVMLFSIAVTTLLVLYQRRVVRATRSVAIAADNYHYAGDVLTNLGVILGIVLAAGFGWYAADPLIALAIAAVLAWSAWHVLRQSYDQLMDRELSDAERRRILDTVQRHPMVRGVHELRTRGAGTRRFIQLHIEMDPALSLAAAHRAGDEVEAALLAEFPDADVLIHLDPHGFERVGTPA
jgi:ferrous-iron efflux pump FieF